MNIDRNANRGLKPHHLEKNRTSCITTEVSSANYYTARTSELFWEWTKNVPEKEMRKNGGGLNSQWQKKYDAFCKGEYARVFEGLKGISIKLDVPRTGWDGKVIKYDAQPNTPSPVLIPNHPDDPNFWEEVKANKRTVIITEGSDKVCSLTSIGFAAIGLVGINNYTNKKEISFSDQQDFTKELKSKELKEEIKEFIEAGCHFIICFDQDTKEKTKRAVKAATVDLCQRINNYSNKIGMGNNHPKIPRKWNPEDGKGIDDLQYNKGREFVEKVLADAKPWYKTLDTPLLPPIFNNEDYSSDSRYYKFPIPYGGKGSCAHQSPLGTGKTRELENDSRHRDQVFAPLNRRSLVQGVSDRLRIPNPEEIINSNIAEGFLTGGAFCIERMHKESAIRWNNNLINTEVNSVGYFDEIESTLRTALLSPTCDDHRKEILDNLLWVFKNTPSIHFLDGFLTPETVNWLEKVRGEKIPVSVNHYRGNETTFEWGILPNNKELIRLQIDAINSGETPDVITDSQSAKSKISAQNLAKLINRHCPSVRTLVVDSVTSAVPGSEASRYKFNPDEMIKEWKANGERVIPIRTPVITTGVSIDTTGYFTSRFYFCSGTVSIQDVIQQASRVRETIPLYIAPPDRSSLGLKENGATTPQGVLENLAICNDFDKKNFWGKVAEAKTQRETRKEIESITGDYQENDECDNRIEKYSGAIEFLPLYCIKVAELNKQYKAYKESLLLWAKWQGHTILDLTDSPLLSQEEAKAIGKEVTGIRDESVKEEDDKIIASPAITDIEAEVLERKAQKTLEEHFSLENHKVKKLFGEVTSPILEGRRKGLHRVVNLHVYNRCHEVFENHSKASQRKWRLGSDSNKTLRINEILRRKLTLPTGEIKTFWEVITGKDQYSNDDTELQFINELLKACRRDFKTYTGINIGSANSPIETLRALLKPMGFNLKLVSKIRTPDGRRLRIYTKVWGFEGVDLESIISYRLGVEELKGTPCITQEDIDNGNILIDAISDLMARLKTPQSLKGSFGTED